MIKFPEIEIPGFQLILRITLTNYLNFRMLNRGHIELIHQKFRH